MIKVQGLKKTFGSFYAVNDISFEAGPGKVLGFLGPNGAGKTTTMRMITGFIPPSAGSIEVAGFDIQSQPVNARKQIGYLPENAPLYNDMTVTEFLRFISEIRGFDGSEKQERVDRAIEQCFLQSVRHQTIETLSKGYRQRTCFAQALLHDPSVLLLDEPTDGLDPNQKKVVRDMIREMASTKTIVLSTHILEEVEAICDRAIIISQGRLVKDSTPAKLKKESPDYNAVTLTLVAGEKEAAVAFQSLPDVKGITPVSSDGGQISLRIQPRDGQSITPQILDICRKKNWLVTEVHTHGGRLEDVFQGLTHTSDTEKGAAA